MAALVSLFLYLLAPYSTNTPPSVVEDGIPWTNTGTVKKLYETKREATDRFLEALPVQFDDFLPDWNYVVRPASH